IERGVVLGELHRIVDQAEQVVLEARPRADHADPDTVLVQIGEVATDEAAQQAKQIVDFLARTRPVLRGEAEQSEMGYAELLRGVDRAPYALDALAVAFRARQTALGRPAPLAVHDDRDMTGDLSVGRLEGKLIHRQRHGRLLRFGGKVMSSRPYPIRLA